MATNNGCKACGHINTWVTDKGNIWCEVCNHLEPANINPEPVGNPVRACANHDAARIESITGRPWQW